MRREDCCVPWDGAEAGVSYNSCDGGAWAAGGEGAPPPMGGVHGALRGPLPMGPKLGVDTCRLPR